MKTFLRRKTAGPILLGAVTALSACGVLLLYGLDRGAGGPVFTPLELETETGQSAAPLDLNAARPEELDDLPGIGPVLAERIAAWRDENGPFRQPEDVMEVPGVGPALYEDIAPYIGAEQEDVEP